MRLCIVTQEYPGVSDYFGGIGTLYRGLAPALAAAGAEVHVVTFAPRAGSAPAELEGVRIHALAPGRSWPWHAALWARRVEAALDEHGPFDAVLAPEFRGELWR
ncbi:MAG: hypothetical protein QOE28_1247, partial [Solirubrobacteraceae bacterium]|nr:hypothetical protein [Solirubrobacteraceae bacterium]